jgi:hypothetical protein
MVNLLPIQQYYQYLTPATILTKNIIDCEEWHFL